MKILVEYFKEIEKLFDWYFHLTQIKRIQFNYIAILISLATLAYKNDEQHRKNYSAMCARVDIISNARAQEQKEYAESLQIYFEKVTSLLEKSLRQKEELKQIKEQQ